MKRWLLGSVLLLLLSGFAQAEGLTVEIKRGERNPTPIAVVPFSWSGAGFNGDQMAEIISSNLYRSGQFMPIDKKVTSTQEYFATLKDRFIASEAGGVNASFMYELGDEVWHAVIKDGALVDVGQGAIEPEAGRAVERRKLDHGGEADRLAEHHIA